LTAWTKAARSLGVKVATDFRSAMAKCSVPWNYLPA
jgi:hypothetical protein